MPHLSRFKKQLPHLITISDQELQLTSCMMQKLISHQPKQLVCRNYWLLYIKIFPRNSHISSINYPNQRINSLDHTLDKNLHNLHVHQLFDELPEPDIKSVTTLISQLGKQTRHREAVTCFLRLLLADIKPNEYTFGAVFHSSVALKDLHLGKQIHAYAYKTSFHSNVFVGSAVLDLYVKLGSIEDALKAFKDTDNPNVVSYTTLVGGYMKEGKFDEALEVFRSMPERNEVSWNTMISGCGQNGNSEEAIKFLVEMLREGVVPTQFTFPCAMIAAANIGALNLGRSIHACAVKFLGELGLFLTNSVVSFYAKCGSMDDSLLAFNKICERNVVSWNAVICGYAQNGQGKDAIEMLEIMKLTGSKPNSVTLLGVLMACNHVGLVQEGYKHFNETKDKEPSLLKAEHYACMIDLLSRSGRFEEAEKFILELPFDPGIGFWKAVLGGCQVHSNLGLGEIAARKIMELDPGDVSSYVMLSNAHSAAGRWQSVLKTRQKMREKGLTRIPGSSWIEIHSKVHVFVTGDKQHELMGAIYTVLGYLIEHSMTSQDVIGELYTRVQELDIDA